MEVGRDGWDVEEEEEWKNEMNQEIWRRSVSWAFDCDGHVMLMLILQK